MVYGNVYNNNYSDILEGVGAQEFDESLSFIEMGAQAIEESTQNWNAMMRAVAVTELKCVVESGQEMVYEAVDIKAMAEAVKNWLLNLWKKIQGIAEAALAKFLSWVRDDKKWYESYAKRIEIGYRNAPSSLKFNGYVFPDLDSFAAKISASDVDGQILIKAQATNGNLENMEGFTAPDAKYIDDMVDEHIAAITGDTTIKSDSFRKDLFKLFHGAEKKQKLGKSDINLANIKTVVTTTKSTVDNVKKSRDEIKKTIKNEIAKVDEMSKKATQNANKKDGTADDYDNYSAVATQLSFCSKALKKIQSTNATFFSCYISALKDRNRQSKAIAVKMVSYAAGGFADKKVKNESTYYEDGESMLESSFANLFI